MANHHMEAGNPIFLFLSASFFLLLFSLCQWCFNFCPVVYMVTPAFFSLPHTAFFFTFSFWFCASCCMLLLLSLFQALWSLNLIFFFLMLLQCCTCPLGGSGRHSQGDQWAASSGWHCHSVLQVSTAVCLCVYPWGLSSCVCTIVWFIAVKNKMQVFLGMCFRKICMCVCMQLFCVQNLFLTVSLRRCAILKHPT